MPEAVVNLAELVIVNGVSNVCRVRHYSNALTFQIVHLKVKVKITRLSHTLVQWEIKRAKREAAICGARLLSVSRQVGGHLWHEGPAGGL